MDMINNILEKGILDISTPQKHQLEMTIQLSLSEAFKELISDYVNLKGDKKLADRGILSNSGWFKRADNFCKVLLENYPFEVGQVYFQIAETADESR